MDANAPWHASRTVEIRVRGVVGRRCAASFEDMDVSFETVLRGDVPDQAALHGLLERIRDLGFDLIEVRQVGSS